MNNSCACVTITVTFSHGIQLLNSVNQFNLNGTNTIRLVQVHHTLVSASTALHRVIVIVLEVPLMIFLQLEKASHYDAVGKLASRQILLRSLAVENISEFNENLANAWYLYSWYWTWYL